MSININPVSPADLRNRLVTKYRDVLVAAVNDLLVESGKGDGITITQDDLTEVFQHQDTAGLVWLAETEMEAIYMSSGWIVTARRGDIGPNENPGTRWTFTTQERDWR